MFRNIFRRFKGESCYRTERVHLLGTSRAKHLTSRIAMKKDWLFYYEWSHPGELEANDQKPELPIQGSDQISKYTGETTMQKCWQGRF